MRSANIFIDCDLQLILLAASMQAEQLDMLDVAMRLFPNGIWTRLPVTQSLPAPSSDSGIMCKCQNNKEN